MSQGNDARFYANVPQTQRDEYVTFRNTHPFRSQQIDGTTWNYIDCGTKQPDTTPLLILVGGLRVADAGYRAITILKNERRIIAPTYPALNTMTALTDGIVKLLGVLDIERVDVLGGSFGGMVAQALVHRHGQYVRKLVLSSTGLMTEKSIRERKKTRRWLRLLPDSIVRRLTERRLFTIINPPPDTHFFWRAYLQELFAQRLTKADVVSTLDCMIDFGENFNMTSNEQQAFTGDVLIIGSKDDKTFDQSRQYSLHSVFPTAQVFTFSDAGHSPSMTQTELYFRQVRDFLHT